jgi:hypothetical protein
VPDETASGLYLVRLRVTNNDEELPTASAAGDALGAVYLGPIRVVGKETFREVPAEPVARMGPVSLQAVQAFRSPSEPQRLEVRMLWSVVRPVPRNYKVSVRLIRPDPADPTSETVISQDDKQPLYGFYPTSMWRAGEQVLDPRWLDLAPDTPAGDGYVVEVVLYDERTMEVAGIGRVAGVTLEEIRGPEASSTEQMRAAVSRASTSNGLAR